MKLSNRVPRDGLLASSVSLGWSGLVVESALCPPGTMTSTPRPELMVCMALSSIPGAVVQTYQGRRHTALFARGVAQVVPSGTVGTWSHEAVFEHMNVYLPRATVARAMDDVLPGDPDAWEVSPQFEAKDAAVEHLCLALLEELQAGGSSGQLYRDSLALALASRLVRQFGIPPLREPKGSTRPARLAKIVDYIDAHLANDLSLDQLAREAGMSRTYFVTVFSQTYGTPPYRYLLTRRIERARALLAESDLSPAEVAVASGFYDQSHLARHLRRRWGVSPSELRNRKNVL